MNKQTYAFVAAVTFVAAGVAAILLAPGFASFSGRDWLGLLGFAGLCILSEFLAVDYSIASQRTAKSSMAYVPLLTCAIVYPPQGAILVAAIFEGFTQAILRRSRLWKFCINVSLAVIAIGVSGWVYQVLGGRGSEEFRVPLIPFFLMALTFSIVNIFLVSVFYALRNQSSFRFIMREVTGPGAVNAVYSMLGSPFAVFAAYLYNQLYVGGLVLVVFPLMLIRYSYLSKIQLQQANRDLLKVLVKTIETRDPYTSGHSLRVSRLARAIAEDIGLPLRHVEIVETAALLHDVGKIDSVYAEIIRKPTALTDDEHRVIRTHSVKGAELLQNLTSFPREVIEAVRHHHERYDGKGYPDGLVGRDIPIAARIIMLCDAIDAMLSDRPYRRALQIDEVEAEITRCSATQFDPDIVSTVVRKNTLHRALDLIHAELPPEQEVVAVEQ